ncbi:MAG: hypothetical protein ABFC84_16755 [Veillonellales bacterium]
MSDITKKPQSEDRAILTLESLRGRLVSAIAEIDKEIKYLERCKKARGGNAGK